MKVYTQYVLVYGKALREVSEAKRKSAKLRNFLEVLYKLFI